MCIYTCVCIYIDRCRKSIQNLDDGQEVTLWLWKQGFGKVRLSPKTFTLNTYTIYLSLPKAMFIQEAFKGTKMMVYFNGVSCINLCSQETVNPWE